LNYRKRSLKFAENRRNLEVIFDLETKLARLDQLQKIQEDSDFWTDPHSATALLREQKQISRLVDNFLILSREIEDAEILLDLAVEESDESSLREVEEKISLLGNHIRDIEIQRLFSRNEDCGDAIVEIHAGAGGTEAQDWAEMLLRMYVRWAEREGYKAEILDTLPGEEAGLKSVTFSVSGDYSYGKLRAEGGIHRLVRISPFDANSRRHTSFSAVFVYPSADEEVDIQVNESDLKIDTYRASGAGGQHVNKTDSAVRITHLPTGIVVQCQNERSQHKNKAMAMKILKSRLYDLELQKKREEKDNLHKTKKDIAWGSQIRSYVLQPYQMVKDHRTNLEIGNVSGVLDGDLNRLMQEYLLFESRMNVSIDSYGKMQRAAV
jgi:peptide chain release factor 2